MANVLSMAIHEIYKSHSQKLQEFRTLLLNSCDS